MKLGIFAKTFSRPTIEELFQSIAGYEINSVQFNLSCAGLDPLPQNVPSELAQRIADSAEQAKVELSAISGTFNMAHPDPVDRSGNLSKFEVLVRSRRHTAYSRDHVMHRNAGSSQHVEMASGERLQRGLGRPRPIHRVRPHRSRKKQPDTGV